MSNNFPKRSELSVNFGRRRYIVRWVDRRSIHIKRPPALLKSPFDSWVHSTTVEGKYVCAFGGGSCMQAEPLRKTEQCLRKGPLHLFTNSGRILCLAVHQLTKTMKTRQSDKPQNKRKKCKNSLYSSRPGFTQAFWVSFPV